MQFLTNLYFNFSTLRLIPHMIAFLVSSNKKEILEDVNRWAEIRNFSQKNIKGLLYMLTFHREYRNLFYYRIGLFGLFLKIICPEEKTLFINVKKIGGGDYLLNMVSQQ